MPSFVNRLFNLRPHEWPRVLLLFLMAFMAVTGITWGKLTVQPLFWNVVGVDRLGYSFVVEGLLAIALVVLYSPFADRLANDRLLIVIALLSATAVAGGWFLLQAGSLQAGYFMLYPLFTVIPFILNLHWWTYITGFYDARAAKRIVPVLASNARLAGAFAGLSVAGLTNWLGSAEAVIALWAVLLAVMAVLVWLAPFIWQTSGQTAVTAPSPSSSTVSYTQSVRDGYQYVANSPYLRWLAIATLLVTLLLTLLKYQSSDIINAAFNSDSLLSQRFSSATDFLGKLEGLTNLLMLPVQIFLLSRLIGKSGLNKANLLFPSGTAGVALTLLGLSLISLTPGLIILGALAYLTANVFNTTFRNPIDNLLYNAVPLRMKGRARAFVNGMLVPTASLIGGLLLLLPFVTGTTWFLPVLLAVVAIIYFAAAVRVSQHYTNALVSMLEQEDYSFLLDQEPVDLTVTDAATLERLQQRLAQSQSDEFTLFMVTLISDVGGSEAVPILADLARHSNTHIRTATLDILAATDARSPAAHDLYAEFLQDMHPQVRRSALAGLERVNGRSQAPYLSMAAAMLADLDVAVRTQALPALLQYGDVAQRAQALQLVQTMLASEDKPERTHALRVLGQTEDTSFIGEIITALSDPSDPVRLEAALILEAFSAQKLSQQAADAIVLVMSPLLTDPVERVREAALVTLARVGDHHTYGRLVESLKDPSPQIQATAVNTLTSLGKKVIPMVHPQLDSPNAQLRKMATVILTRVNRREYGPLVTAQIQSNLLQMAENAGYLDALEAINSYAAVGVLQNVFREANDRLADQIFFLLTAVQDNAAVRVIRESLASKVPRVRANALEALESLTTPQTAEVIGAMLHPHAPTAAILDVCRKTWDMPFPTTAEAMEKLVTDLAVEPWPRSIATFALGQIGQAMITPQKTTAVPPETAVPESLPPPAEPDGRHADVSQALLDDDPTPATETHQPGKMANRQQTRRDRAAKASSLLDILAGEAHTGQPTASEVAQPEVPATLETLYYPPPSFAKSLPITRVLAMLTQASLAPEEGVRLAAQHAHEMIAGKGQPQLKESAMLSTIERIIFLKEVLFFREMTVDQLKVLATVCEEVFYNEDATIYKEGDAGGVLYVVVRGRVSIERESRRDAVARLATIEAYAYFGEMNLFDESPHTDTAVALQDTLTLNLRREPLIALARQYPDLSLELINVLSQRLRETTDQVARLTRSHPRALHKVFDQLE